MIKSLYDERPDLFTIFQSNNWERASTDTIKKNFQEMINELSRIYGASVPLCNVEIVKSNLGHFKGEYVHESHTLRLEHNLVVDKLKPPYYINGTAMHSPLTNKDAFETFIHEFRHAIQQYEKQTTYIKEPNDFTKLLLLNDEHKQNTKIKAYFKGGNMLADALYFIQPSERDAFLFASQMCQQFNGIMHSVFPEDLAFVVNDDFSNFQENVKAASQFFHTSTPFEDIDDILRHINGIEPLKPLNQEMWEAVQKTQSKSLKQQVMERFSYDATPVSNETNINVPTSKHFEPSHEIERD